ncbi:MAG: hypothetical protein ACE5JI_21530, partial [Acidobacteriota bacterium]
MNTRRGWTLGATFAAAIALGACQQTMNMLKARQAFKDANVAYSAKEYGKAIEEYQKVLELDPEGDPRVIIPAYFYAGSSHHLLYRPARFDDPENEAHLDSAIELYEKTLEKVAEASDSPHQEQLKPYIRYANEQLAAIYRDNLDDLEMSEKYYRALIELEPEAPETWYALGDLYERFYDPDLEEEEGEEGESEDSEAEPKMSLLDKAIEAYRKPVEMNPDDPVEYRQVAARLN